MKKKIQLLILGLFCICSSVVAQPLFKHTVTLSEDGALWNSKKYKLYDIDCMVAQVPKMFIPNTKIIGKKVKIFGKECSGANEIWYVTIKFTYKSKKYKIDGSNVDSFPDFFIIKKDTK